MCVVFLTSYVEHNLPWDNTGVAFYFSFLVHIMSSMKIYQKDDFFSTAEAILDLTLALGLKFSKQKFGMVHYVVIVIIIFLGLMYRTKPKNTVVDGEGQTAAAQEEEETFFDADQIFEGNDIV